MIKDKSYKIIITILIVIFVVGLFFSARFLNAQFKKATNPTLEENINNTLNLEAWEKIKHRFVK